MSPETGEISPVWRAFLLTMFARTGGSSGTTPQGTSAAVAKETTDRVAADATISANLANEAVTRSTADAALTAALAAEAATRRDGVASVVAKISTLLNTSGAKTFTFAQVTPSDVWGIAHNLNWHPTVTVVDTANQLVEGGVTYDSSNIVTLRFASPFAGTAYLV